MNEMVELKFQAEGPDLIENPSIVFANRDLVNIHSQPGSFCGAWNQICEWDFWTFPEEIQFIESSITQEAPYTYAAGWIITSDPLTQADLNDEEGKLQEIIFQIRTLNSLSFRENLAKRLLSLLYDAKEENEGIRLASLINFYEFLTLYPNIKCPIISLTPDNDLYATWRFEQNRLFSVRFLSNKDVQLVIFKPNELHPNKTDRFLVTTTVDSLKGEVKPHGIWNWISE
jgi:hypothetical protein